MIAPAPRKQIRGISLDLGNTIYPLRNAETAQITARLHRFLERRLDATLCRDTLSRLYLEIRARQFAENRATLRENDFDQRLREMISGVHCEPEAELVREASDAYAAGFVEALILPDGARDVVKRLSERFDGNVVVCSNFILFDPIRDVLERDGLLPLLNGVIVSCEVGFIKPHPLIFETVASVLELDPSEIAHVGDDLDADIFGANRAGMTSVFTSEFLDDVAAQDGSMPGPDYSIRSFSELSGLFD